MTIGKPSWNWHFFSCLDLSIHIDRNSPESIENPLIFFQSIQFTYFCNIFCWLKYYDVVLLQPRSLECGWQKLRPTLILQPLVTPPSSILLMVATCIASRQWRHVPCWMCLALHTPILKADTACTIKTSHLPISQVPLFFLPFTSNNNHSLLEED